MTTSIKDLVYPHNVLRNVARSGVFTEFVFLIDIDLVPNHLLRSDFLKLANEENLWDIEKDQRIFVVPVSGLNIRISKICLRALKFPCPFLLTLTRPIGLPPHASVAQKITDQR